MLHHTIVSLRSAPIYGGAAPKARWCSRQEIIMRVNNNMDTTILIMSISIINVLLLLLLL